MGANVYADGVCRMDGSGRSYYQLSCDETAETVSGVLGCSNDDCTGCSQEVTSFEPNECTTKDWLGGLTVAVLMDTSVVCTPYVPPSTTATPSSDEGCEVCNDNGGASNSGNLNGDVVTGCDEQCDGTSMNMTLEFDTCDVSVFDNARCDLWDEVADCVCGLVYGATEVSTADGRGDNACSLQVVDYSLMSSDYTGDGCTGDVHRLVFDMENCVSCVELDIMEAAFNAHVEDNSLINEMETCLTQLGLTTVKDTQFAYSRYADDGCDVNESGASMMTVIVAAIASLIAAAIAQ